MAGRILLFALGTAAVAAIAGAFVGVLGRYAYVVLGSPLLAALGAGIGGRGLAGVLRINSPVVGTVVGMLAGLVAMQAIGLVQLRLHRAEMTHEVQAVTGISEERAQAEVDRSLDQLTGGSTGPNTFRIHAGVRMFGATALDLGAGINGLILFFDFAAASWLLGRLIRHRTREPYCADCDRWYTRRVVGSAPLTARSDLFIELENGRFHRLGRRLAPPRATTRDPFVLHCWMCDRCDHGDVHFELEQTHAGRRRVIKTKTVPHDGLDEIMDAHALKQG